MNIGYAKPYGYGTVRIDISNAERIDTEKAYSCEAFNAEPYTGLDVKKEIECYKNHVKKTFGIKLTEQSNIKGLLKIKDSGTRIGDADMTYMDLKEFQGTKDNFVLPRYGKLILKRKDRKEE